MAVIEEAIKARLKDVTAVTDLVSDRIFPLKIPKNAPMPALTYERVSGERISVMGNDTGIATARIQINIFGNSYASVVDLATAVRNALQRYRGIEPNTSVVIDSSFIDNDIDFFNDNAENGSVEAGKYQRSQDYLITHREGA